VARTYQCWDCGRRVGEDEVRRHTVTSGYRRTSRVNLCPTCLAKHERRDRIVGVVLLVVVAAFVVVVFVLPRLR
jgi:DNA-directed RNA polymerase subunit RPC12/RpoP